MRIDGACTRPDRTSGPARDPAAASSIPPHERGEPSCYGIDGDGADGVGGDGVDGGGAPGGGDGGDGGDGDGDGDGGNDGDGVDGDGDGGDGSGVPGDGGDGDGDGDDGDGIGGGVDGSGVGSGVGGGGAPTGGDAGGASVGCGVEPVGAVLMGTETSCVSSGFARGRFGSLPGEAVDCPSSRAATNVSSRRTRSCS
jgi:hypothetical protein